MKPTLLQDPTAFSQWSRQNSGIPSIKSFSLCDYRDLPAVLHKSRNLVMAARQQLPDIQTRL
jgi:hypothetical protein